MTPHQFASEYEFRGDGADHTPSDSERTMIEDAIEGYLAAQPASPLRGKWQPMSSAPKDAEIIGQDPDGRIFNLRWEPDDCGENWYDVHGDQLAYPVRWMPMPSSASPPEQPAAAPVTALADLLSIIDDLDQYQKRPDRGDYGVECACCMGELFDADDRVKIEVARALSKETKA